MLPDELKEYVGVDGGQSMNIPSRWMEKSYGLPMMGNGYDEVRSCLSVRTGWITWD